MRQLKNHNMKHRLKFLILTFWILITVSCGMNNKKNAPNENVDQIVKIDTLLKDTVELTESFNEEDTPVNEYLTDRLKPIRVNFKRINSIENWTSTNKIDLWETNEGGEATFYYLNGHLEKITTKHFGEMFQKLTEYYLLNGQLSFVFEKSYKYNRPVYYDSTMMKENNDTEIFDLEKSEIIEERSYFEKGKLIHQLNNQDCGSPFADDYLLEEQIRILENFEKFKEK